MTTGRRPSIGGLVLFLYLVAWMGQLLLLFGVTEDYDRVASWWASPAGRVVAGAVLLAAVHHLLHGIRRIVSHSPDGAVGGAVVLFLTWALVVPGWAILFRPWLTS